MEKFELDLKKYPGLAMILPYVKPRCIIKMNMRYDGSEWIIKKFKIRMDAFTEELDTVFNVFGSGTVRLGTKDRLRTRSEIRDLGDDFLYAIVNDKTYAIINEMTTKYQGYRLRNGDIEQINKEFTDFTTGLEGRIMGAFDGNLDALRYCFASAVIEMVGKKFSTLTTISIDKWHEATIAKLRGTEENGSDTAPDPAPVAIDELNGTEYEGWTRGEFDTLKDPNGVIYTAADETYWNVMEVLESKGEFRNKGEYKKIKEDNDNGN